MVFASFAYAAGLPAPRVRQSIPRLITFQRKRANRRILNEEELIEMLRGYGELQVSIWVYVGYQCCLPVLLDLAAAAAVCCVRYCSVADARRADACAARELFCSAMVCDGQIHLKQSCFKQPDLI